MDFLGIANIAAKVIDKFIPDPQAKADALFKLKELEQKGELAQLANDLELEKLSVDNIKSAREREAQIVTSEHTPYITKITTTVLAWGIIGITFFLYGQLLFSTTPITPEKKDIIIYILGALTAISTQIVGYYFGSTVGSSKRTDSLVNMVKNK